MFAKLVVGSTNVYSTGVMRDIGRLITSNTPNTSLIQTFNAASSVVYDATPAGWTYVGSNHSADRPTIADGSTAGDGAQWNLCFSAPCLSGSALKYAVLSSYNYSSQASVAYAHGFCLTGASSASSLGVVTNEGPRMYASGATSSSGQNAATTDKSLGAASGTVYYVIASPRHLTIVRDAHSMAAIWESSMTNAHSFYGDAPFISMTHYNIASVGIVETSITPSAYGAGLWGVCANAYDVTNPNTGTNYGVYDLGTNNFSGFHLAQITASTTLRTSTIDSVGNPKYVVQPIFYAMDKIGYPTQYVTGVTPIYFTKSSIGNTGDTINVNGVDYTFIDVSTKFGIIVNVAG